MDTIVRQWWVLLVGATLREMGLRLGVLAGLLSVSAVWAGADFRHGRFAFFSATTIEGVDGVPLVGRRAITGDRLRGAPAGSLCRSARVAMMAGEREEAVLCFERRADGFSLVASAGRWRSRVSSMELTWNVADSAPPLRVATR